MLEVSLYPDKAAQAATNPGSETIISRNEARNGIEVKFARKPTQEVIDKLKQNSFRWHHGQKLWYAKFTDERLRFAQSLVG